MNIFYSKPLDIHSKALNTHPKVLNTHPKVLNAHPKVLNGELYYICELFFLTKKQKTNDLFCFIFDLHYLCKQK